MTIFPDKQHDLLDLTSTSVDKVDVAKRPQISEELGVIERGKAFVLAKITGVSEFVRRKLAPLMSGIIHFEDEAASLATATQKKGEALSEANVEAVQLSLVQLLGYGSMTAFKAAVTSGNISLDDVARIKTFFTENYTNGGAGMESIQGWLYNLQNQIARQVSELPDYVRWQTACVRLLAQESVTFADVHSLLFDFYTTLFARTLSRQESYIVGLDTFAAFGDLVRSPEEQQAVVEFMKVFATHYQALFKKIDYTNQESSGLVLKNLTDLAELFTEAETAQTRTYATVFTQASTYLEALLGQEDVVAEQGMLQSMADIPAKIPAKISLDTNTDVVLTEETMRQEFTAIMGQVDSGTGITQFADLFARYVQRIAHAKYEVAERLVGTLADCVLLFEDALATNTDGMVQFLQILQRSPDIFIKAQSFQVVALRLAMLARIIAKDTNQPLHVRRKFARQISFAPFEAAENKAEVDRLELGLYFDDVFSVRDTLVSFVENYTDGTVLKCQQFVAGIAQPVVALLGKSVLQFLKSSPSAAKLNQLSTQLHTLETFVQVQEYLVTMAGAAAYDFACDTQNFTEHLEQYSGDSTSLIRVCAFTPKEVMQQDAAITQLLRALGISRVSLSAGLFVLQKFVNQIIAHPHYSEHATLGSVVHVLFSWFDEQYSFSDRSFEWKAFVQDFIDTDAGARYLQKHPQVALVLRVPYVGEDLAAYHRKLASLSLRERLVQQDQLRTEGNELLERLQRCARYLAFTDMKVERTRLLAAMNDRHILTHTNEATAVGIEVLKIAQKSRWRSLLDTFMTASEAYVQEFTSVFGHYKRPIGAVFAAGIVGVSSWLGLSNYSVAPESQKEVSRDVPTGTILAKEQLDVELLEKAQEQVRNATAAALVSLDEATPEHGFAQKEFYKEFSYAESTQAPLVSSLEKSTLDTQIILNRFGVWGGLKDRLAQEWGLKQISNAKFKAALAYMADEMRKRQGEVGVPTVKRSQLGWSIIATDYEKQKREGTLTEGLYTVNAEVLSALIAYGRSTPAVQKRMMHKVAQIAHTTQKDEQNDDQTQKLSAAPGTAFEIDPLQFSLFTPSLDMPPNAIGTFGAKLKAPEVTKSTIIKSTQADFLQGILGKDQDWDAIDAQWDAILENHSILEDHPTQEKIDAGWFDDFGLPPLDKQADDFLKQHGPKKTDDK